MIRDLRPVLLQLTGMSSTKFGGMESYLIEVIRQCRAFGYRSVIQYESMPASQHYLNVLESLDVELVVLRTHRRNLSSVVGLLKLIRRLRPSVIQTHFATAFVIADTARWGRLFGARRIVTTVHNKMPPAGNQAAIRAYNRCDHVLAVSRAVESNLVEQGVRKKVVSTHYLGIPDPPQNDPVIRRTIRSEFDIPEDAIVIGNLAFDAPFKGVDVMLRAFRRVVDRFQNVYLLQVGVETASPLLALAKSLGLSHRVRWAGIRDNGFRLMNAADFYVQPSRYGEGLPLSIMESMALQLPVVATQVSGNTEAVIDDETGFLVAPDNEGALGSSILRMIDKSDQWQRMGINGLKRFQALFDGKKSVNELVHRYYDL